MPSPIGKNPMYPVMPYGTAIARGYVEGHTSLFKTGYNPDVDATEEDLWSVGGSYVFPAAAAGLEVVSSSDNDKTGSTGALTVKIWYLDAAFTEKTEVVIMNGTTVVPTVATDIYRVNAFRVITAGTAGAAVGDIDIRHLDNTPIYSRIAATHTRARNSIYTVPAGKTLYISQLSFSITNPAGGRSAKFTLRGTYDDKVQAASTLFYPYYEIGIQDGAISMCLEYPITFPAGTDIKISVIGDAGNADAVCTGSYLGWLS
jgi:hypothetical protein